MYDVLVFLYFLQLMESGAPGSPGVSALSPVEPVRGHVPDCVTTPPPVTVAGRVQETPHSCPGATFKPAQVRLQVW